MKRGEIARIKRLVSKGHYEMRLAEIESELKRVRQNLNHIEMELAERCQQFQQELGAWGIEERAAAGPPVFLTAQLRRARLYLAGALCATIIEVLVAGFIALKYQFPPWFPMLIAVLLPLVLKTGLAAFLHDEERPHETLHRLRLFVLGPSLTLFVPAIILLLAGRIANESLAELLLPLLTLAPLALALGCLGAAAALFGLWHLLAWSKSTAVEYRRRSIEHINTEELYNYLMGQKQRIYEHREAQFKPQRGLNKQMINGQAAEAPRASVRRNERQLVASARQRNLQILLLLLQTVAYTGCTQLYPPAVLPPQNTEQPAANGLPTMSHGGSILLYVDISDSLASNSRRIAVQNVLGQLSELAEASGARSLEAFTFAQSGWECKSFFRKQLPEKPFYGTGQKSTDFEWDLFGNGAVKDAAQHSAQRKSDEQLRASLKQYRAELQSNLAGLTEQMLLSAEPTGGKSHTDLNGLLARIVELSADGRRQLVFLITDGVDTRTGRLEPVRRPAGEVTLIVVLTSSQARQRGDQEYKLRSREFLKACPWAIVMPYFLDNYQQVIELGKSPINTSTD